MFKAGDRVSFRISDFDAKVLNSIVSYYEDSDLIPMRFRSKTEVFQMALCMIASRFEDEGFASFS